MLLELRVIGVPSPEEKPRVALYLLDASGQIQRKVASAKEAMLEVDPELAKQAPGLVALGPDVEEPEKLEPDTLLHFRLQERLREWERAKAIEIPEIWWNRWCIFRVCVSGRVRKCLFPLFAGPLREVASEAIRVLSPTFPWPPRICFPLCNGVVEVYERVCCCRPPIIIDLPEIIAKLKAVVATPVFPPGRPPLPDPPPDRIARRAWKKLAAFQQADPLAMPDPRIHQDVRELETLSPPEALKYLQERDYLWPFWCFCRTRRLGETTLNPDGTFNFCYFRFPYIQPANCHTMYAFRVRQWQETQWVYVYDGLKAHQYFTASQFADLTTFLGRSCGQPPPPPGGPKPFVMLQDVGSTHSYSLVSHYMGKDGAGKDLTQTGQYSVASPVPNAGLVHPGYDAPWGETLHFRLYFHPGMKALGAFYYRVSIVKADANGNPELGATPQAITNAVSWRKFVVQAGKFEVASESLGPNPGGLYKIPYDADALWLGGQFHQSLDTRQYANGRFLIVVEVFDSNGTRLRPVGAIDPGTDKDFVFERWLEDTGPDSLAVVPFAALTHIFWFDNRKCYGDIEDLKVDHQANTQECQFLSGPSGTLFSVGFRAFHAATADPIPAPHTFMERYRIWYHRGLNGPNVTIETGTTNHPPTLLSGPNAESASLTFADMLGTDTRGAKCSFAANLYVWAKHTNGSRRLWEYDAEDQAAFALEIV